MSGGVEFRMWGMRKRKDDGTPEKREELTKLEELEIKKMEPEKSGLRKSLASESKVRARPRESQ